MFCPKCKAEYREGFTVCAECQVPLVEELPPEPEVEYRELYEVYSTWKIIEADFIKSVLDSHDIECYIHNRYYPSLTPIGSGAVPIKVMVPEEDKRKAEKIIEQYLKDM
ncbi:MAG: DUF2007 domain-containing protein [Elusimicrobiota bacterium]